MHEVIIRGGTVVDGTGTPPRVADVAIDDERISEVGRLGAQGTRIREADGPLVTPGWVDIHTHYDGQTTLDPAAGPSSWHGVTDRGTIEPGALGDLYLIDCNALALTGPYVAADLPARGKRLLQKAEGSVAAVQTGAITFEAGEATEELPGRLLRGSR